MNCREPGCDARVGPMSLTGYCYFHANDVTRDDRGRFKSWGLRGRTPFKGGTFKLGLLIKGYEVDNGWRKALEASPEIRDMLKGAP